MTDNLKWLLFNLAVCAWHIVEGFALGAAVSGCCIGAFIEMEMQERRAKETNA